MHPAFSVIFFTTTSGAGYGMLVWLGALTPFGLLPSAPGFGAVALGLALALISLGLLSSTFHLGHPERAWRAVSQWRTSWLSREGVAALLTYVPALGFGATWLMAGTPDRIAQACGVLMALFAIGTVCCTAMIYASLKPIRQWHNAYVLPVYLLAALSSGGAALCAVAGYWQASAPLLGAALAATLLLLVVKCAYWRAIDSGVGARTPAHATGLSAFGTVRQIDGPHTEENFLLTEMGYRIGRKHAVTLRGLVLAAGLLAPVILLLTGMAPIAAVLVLGGLVVERWLFFAEATHTVTLYYGRPG